LVICFGAGMTWTRGAWAFTEMLNAIAQASAKGKLALRVRVILIAPKVFMIPISFCLSRFVRRGDYLPDIDGDYNRLLKADEV